MVHIRQWPYSIKNDLFMHMYFNHNLKQAAVGPTMFQNVKNITLDVRIYVMHGKIHV